MTVLRYVVAGIGALCLFVGVQPQASVAQEESFDAERPVASLQEASPATETDLIELATALQKARAKTDISYNEYQKGVQFFRKHHPDFYGNFFGDPFFATYDVQYSRLARARQFAEPDINPQNSFRANDWFFCPPMRYDPAFNGQCRGTPYTIADFFTLPSGPAFTGQDLLAQERNGLFAALPPLRLPQRRANRIVSREPDTARTPPSRESIPERSADSRVEERSVATAKPVQAAPSEVEADRISTPDEIEPPSPGVVSTSDPADTPSRDDLARARDLIQRQRNGGQLSRAERRELMSTLQRVADRQRRVNRGEEEREGTERLRRRGNRDVNRPRSNEEMTDQNRSDADREGVRRTEEHRPDVDHPGSRSREINRRKSEPRRSSSSRSGNTDQPVGDNDGR